MVGVAPHFLKIVVLAAHADALLRVCGTDVVTPAGTEEHILKLVHPGIGEQQGRVAVRDHRGAGDDAVAPLRKEVKKTLSYLR